VLSTKSETTGQSATKYCTVCKQHKVLKAFSKDKQKPDGLYPHCKTCNSLNTKRRKQYREIHPKPANNQCQCCGAIDELVVDHCHETQDFRGWICKSCNHGIGKLGDTPEGVLKALDYLMKPVNLKTHPGGADDLATA
jgi:CRISPR/Cas system-associated protein Cas10 (large subunit of type III CRISPR-Cas system)